MKLELFYAELDKIFPERVKQREAVALAGGMCDAKDDGYGCTLPLNHEGNKHQAHSSLGKVIHEWNRS